jgi:hypothetical protein
MDKLMTFNLDDYLRDELSVLDAVDMPGGAMLDRPTPTELWYWKLENTVWNIVDRPRSFFVAREESKDEYDHFRLYAHQDELQTLKDIQSASDDVLLESLRLSNVQHWGWLQFMVRELNWYMLLAANWGLPGLRGEYGGNNSVRVDAAEGQRRALAALYFLDLMKERGMNPLAELREKAIRLHEESNIPFDEAKFIEVLRKRDEWSCYVWTCRSVPLGPDVWGDAGPVQYDGEHGQQFLADIRDAALRRRLLSGVVQDSLTM